MLGYEKDTEPIILASTSPRRKEILGQLQIPFYSIAPPFDETLPPFMKRGTKVRKAAEYLAVQKALSAAHALRNKELLQSTNPPLKAEELKRIRFIAAADTLIVFKRKIYGKPENEREARDFLSAFSGKRHRVYTGIAVYNLKTDTYLSRTCVSRVRFARPDKKETERYIKSNEWMDAAGAYKIQGTAQCFIKRIEGSYSSIMGLPIFEFYEILKKSGYAF